MVEGWGYRTLYDDAHTEELREDFVDRIASYTPSTILLAVGTNDYGLCQWDVASFRIAYAALLSDLHEALPNANVVCQTPIVRSFDTLYCGATLQQYRDAIASVCSSESWMNVVDGRDILDIGDTDGLHPTTSGYAKYAKRIAPYLSGPSSW